MLDPWTPWTDRTRREDKNNNQNCVREQENDRILITKYYLYASTVITSTTTITTRPTTGWFCRTNFFKCNKDLATKKRSSECDKEIKERLMHVFRKTRQVVGILLHFSTSNMSEDQSELNSVSCSMNTSSACSSQCRGVLPSLPTGGSSSLIPSGCIVVSTNDDDGGPAGCYLHSANGGNGVTLSNFLLNPCKLTSASLIIPLKSRILIVLPAEIQFWLWRCYFSPPKEIKFWLWRYYYYSYNILFIYFSQNWLESLKVSEAFKI